MGQRAANSPLPIYDRALLLHGSKSNEVLSLAEVERYGLDSFGDADYITECRLENGTATASVCWAARR